MPLVIELRKLLPLAEGERFYKGYFIPGKPGWARVMISKSRSDNSIESLNLVVFTDNEGNILWKKEVLRKKQSKEVFEADLEEFKSILEEAGLLIFIEDYGNEP